VRRSHGRHRFLSRTRGAGLVGLFASILVLLFVTLVVPSAFSAEASGVLSADTTWSVAASPHVVTGPIVVGKGVTLTVEAGATVHLTAGVDLVVTNGGRLLAEGTTDKRIRFSRPPGVTQTLGWHRHHGGPDSPESRIINTHIEGNDFTAIFSQHGTLWLESLTFGTRDRQ